MNRGKIVFLTIIVLTFSIIAGCDESDKLKVDRAAETAVEITEKGDEVLSSPVGALIPPQYHFWLRLAGAAAVLAAGGWQEYRRRDLKKVLTAVVVGNEQIEHTAEFKQAQNTAQSVVGAQDKVAAIRKKTAVL